MSINCFDASWYTWRPPSTDPVKETKSTDRVSINLLIVWCDTWIDATRSGGRLVLANASTKASPHDGVSRACLISTALPASKPGITTFTAISSG